MPILCLLLDLALPGNQPVHRGLDLVVSAPLYDIEAARAKLVGRGVDVSELFHDVGDVFHHGGTEGHVTARTRNAACASFASFSDPDGNGWLFQEIKTRLPGR